jgi:hypothetical protein
MPSQPDAARLDFATAAAYQETTSRGRGRLLGREVPAMLTFVTRVSVPSKDSAIRPSKTGSPQWKGVKDAYLMMGEYDRVVVTEVPNDETAAKMALGTAMPENVRTLVKEQPRSGRLGACRGKGER